MRNILVLVFLLSFSNSFSQSDFKSVQLPPSSKLAQFYGQSEPAIAIHPKNQNIIAAACILKEYYYSMDGGNTWTSKAMKSKYGVWGDPVLTFDTNFSIPQPPKGPPK